MMGYTTSQIYCTRDRLIIDVRQFSLFVWFRHFPPRFEFFHHKLGGD